MNYITTNQDNSHKLPVFVVIVSWNVKNHLNKCLLSLKKAGVFNNQIVVVDNNSKDGTTDFIEKKYLNINLIKNDKNKGFAAAVNQGMKRAKDLRVLILNPDCEVYPNSISKCLEIMNHDNRIGIIGCQLLNTDGTIQPSVRSFPKMIDQWLIMLKLHRIFSKSRYLKRYFLSDFNYHKDQDVDQIKGAFFMISDKLIKSIGKFDEKYYLWFEEVDYCYRAKQAGFIIRFTAQAQVTHHSGESFRKVWSLSKQVFFTRSLIIYFKKHSLKSVAYFLMINRPISLFISALITPLSWFKIKAPSKYE